MAVDNISPIVLWEFLRYLYTGEIVNLDIRVEDLFVVADKYDVERLKNACEVALSMSDFVRGLLSAECAESICVKVRQRIRLAHMADVPLVPHKYLLIILK